MMGLSMWLWEQWRHVKRGECVYVIGEGKIQSDTPLSDMAEVVLYRGPDGSLWARKKEEFYDGRFIQQGIGE